MNRSRVKAALASALVASGVAAAPAANAATVGPGANGGHAELLAGQTLTINVTPANSGSTGFHWQVATKPSKKVLHLTSNRRSGDGKRQVFKYKALAPGATSLRLRYRPPGKGKTAKTFRLAVLVNEQEPALDCAAIGHRTAYAIVARSGPAIVFKIRRTVFFWEGTSQKEEYDAYYGCELSQDHAFRLGAVAGRSNPHEFSNVTLRGTVVAYVHDVDCAFGNGDCLGVPRTVESQDLHTGNLIRVLSVGMFGGEDHVVTGLVMSPAGGVAWIEQGKSPEGTVATEVFSSDAPAPSTAPYAQDQTTLDDGQQGAVDPDSLLYDGTNVKWTRGGAQQQAPLK
jgi:predicted secreted protein